MKLGVMIRAHYRAKTLDIALSELYRLGEDLGLDVKVQLLADRPNFLVEKVLDKYRDRLYGLRYCPFEIVSATGYRFMESNELNYRALSRCRPDWVVFADDDRWWEPGAIRKELPRCLAAEDVDIWYGRSLFMWDRPNQYNANREHNAPVLFRWTENNHFVPHRELQAPLPLHDEAVLEGRTGQMKTPLLDYGSYDDEERGRLLDAWRVSGRDPNDKWVSSLREPPDLKTIHLPIDLWSDYKG